MKPGFLCLFLFACPWLVSAQSEEQRLNIIRYGTETEIAALIGELKTENVGYLDGELITLADTTRNKSILMGIFGFFGERSQGGLEKRSRRALEERDGEANETVQAAVEYLGKLKDGEAVPAIKTLLDDEERRFMGAAFRALGRIGGGNSGAADDIADYLMDYYTNRNPGDENRREIITAIGETLSKNAVSFLTDLCDNGDERSVIRMAALESLSKIGDPAGLRPILDAVSAGDPNIRSAAVAALGPFSGAEVDAAILEAFRDSYWRTRVGAAQAAKTRKLAAAVPYLAFRAERDEVAGVKDEAVRALGAIATSEARTTLENLFTERKNAVRTRILAAEMLVELDGGLYAEKIIAEIDDAKQKNQTALYNGFLKAVGAAKAARLEDLASRFLDSGGALEKSFALDIIANNRFTGLAGKVQALTEDNKNAGLARKAKVTLEKLGR